MYQLEDFEAMVADPVRVATFARAIAAAVRPGDHVLEIGTGTGVFAVLAAQAGASHVTAVELNPLVELGPALAAANGVADRITFWRGDVRRLTLDRPVDVLLEDMRGVLPLLGTRWASIADARTRLCRPDVRLVCERDVLFAAPARAPQSVARLLADRLPTLPALDRTPVLTRLQRQSFRVRLDGDALVGPPAAWQTLDYATPPRARLEHALSWTLPAGVTADGLALWFDAELAGGAAFSCAPGAPPVLYGQLFLPFAAPVGAATGGRLAVTVRAHAVEEHWVYDWRGAFEPADGATPTRIEGSTLAEALPSIAELRRTERDALPSPGEAGQALRRLLDGMDGQRSLDVLAAELQQAHPGRFPDLRAARRFASTFVALLEEPDAPTPVGRRGPTASGD